MQFDPQLHQLVGDSGELPVAQEDEIVLKLAMLIEGQCEGLGPSVETCFSPWRTTYASRTIRSS